MHHLKTKLNNERVCLVFPPRLWNHRLNGLETEVASRDILH